MDFESPQPKKNAQLRPRVQELVADTGSFLRTRVWLFSSACVLIVGAAVVQPESLFSAPIFRLGAGAAPRNASEPWSLERRTKPDFVCLVIAGGLRADRAGFGSEPNGETPTLERFASVASIFESSCAQASEPSVSLKSMLSGTYPAKLILEQTGADQRSLMRISNPSTFMQNAFGRVRSELGQWLEQAGYQTTAFSDADWIQGNPSFSESFEGPKQSGQSPIEQATQWVAALNLGETRERHALIIHLDEMLPEGVSSQDSSAGYAHNLAVLDQELGVLFKVIDQRMLWNQGVIILTSDHGTSLGERGVVGHGDLYLEQLMVPLGIKFPESWGVPPGRHMGGVELVDLLPTVQDICAGSEGDWDGHSILPMAFRGRPGRNLLVAQTSSGPHGANPTTRSAIDPRRWQLIQDARGDGLLFFALASDPQALQPVQPGDLEVPSFVTSLFAGRLPD